MGEASFCTVPTAVMTAASAVTTASGPPDLSLGPTPVGGGRSPDLESIFHGSLSLVGLAGEGVLRICIREPPTLSGGAARRAGQQWISYVLIKDMKCFKCRVPRSRHLYGKEKGAKTGMRIHSLLAFSCISSLIWWFLKQ